MFNVTEEITFWAGPFHESRLEALRARKAIVSSSASTNRELYTLEKFCMKGTSIHVKNMRIKTVL